MTTGSHSLPKIRPAFRRLRFATNANTFRPAFPADEAPPNAGRED
jgi:hypothetical protein